VELSSPATQYLIDVIDGHSESQTAREAAVEGLVAIGAATEAALLSFLAALATGDVDRYGCWGHCSPAGQAAVQALNRVNPDWRQGAFAGKMFREIVDTLRTHRVGLDTIKAAEALGDIADIGSVEAGQALISAVADHRWCHCDNDYPSISEAQAAGVSLAKITGESFGMNHTSWLKWRQTHQPGRAES